MVYIHASVCYNLVMTEQLNIIFCDNCGGIFPLFYRQQVYLEPVSPEGRIKYLSSDEAWTHGHYCLHCRNSFVCENDTCPAGDITQDVRAHEVRRIVESAHDRSLCEYCNLS